MGSVECVTCHLPCRKETFGGLKSPGEYVTLECVGVRKLRPLLGLETALDWGVGVALVAAVTGVVVVVVLAILGSRSLCLSQLPVECTSKYGVVGAS